ncbi:response regulator [Coprobacter tertius]|uniref:Response regulator n=1 Tax=Coprobacter tertius TaxID=2944915 RepID=A0ABT1MGG1_9BACT|nr:response regulator [Coprobacter tertius]MCP9610931.1 response regulator [Coprobacter tertius]
MKKILLLDDKETIAKIVSIYLSSEFEIIYFDNAIKGIQWLLEGNLPDLIITDLRMPEMRGDEFLYYVKNNQLLKSIPVIILSSEDSTSERIKLLQDGAEDYIIKPFNPIELKIRIKKIVS